MGHDRFIDQRRQRVLIQFVDVRHGGIVEAQHRVEIVHFEGANHSHK